MTWLFLSRCRSSLLDLLLRNCHQMHQTRGSLMKVPLGKTATTGADSAQDPSNSRLLTLRLTKASSLIRTLVMVFSDSQPILIFPRPLRNSVLFTEMPTLVTTSSRIQELPMTL